ncbi:MAG: UxaA family hydrolase, partial [Monoglobus pectinilyticus]
MGKIKISPLDNVEVNVGGEFDGHKTANRDIKEGEDIIKYGYPIGHAIRDIKKGEHVHTDNIKTNLSGILEYKYEPQLKGVEKADEKAYFKGYVRDDGSVGIRNEIWIVNTVGCVNKTSELL